MYTSIGAENANEILTACTVGDIKSLKQKMLNFFGTDNKDEKKSLTIWNELKDKNNNTPLILVSEKGHTECLKWLLENNTKIDVNACNNNGETAIFVAAKKGFLHCVRLLVQYCADCNMKNKDGISILDVCDTSKGYGCVNTIKLALKGIVEKRVKEKNRYVTKKFNIKTGKEIKEKDVEEVTKNEKFRIYSRSKSTTDSKDNSSSDGSNISSIDFSGYSNVPVRKVYFLDDKSTDKGNHSFSIATYNILAEDYCKPGFFPYATKNVLSWSSRLKLLVDEISSLNSDIICLQEVDHFNDFKQAFSTNYDGYYKKRTGSRNDGCAIFLKKGVFHVKKYVELEFNKCVNDQKLMTDNVAQLMVLDVISSDGNTSSNNDEKKYPKRFVLMTSHLYYKKEAVKRQQARDLVAEGIKLQQEYSNSFSSVTIPIICCGDFNAKPGSFVYQFMTEKNGFQSSYHHQRAVKTDYYFTSVTQNPSYLDYIFYTSNLSVPLSSSSSSAVEVFKLQKLLQLPTSKVLAPNPGLGSDHLVLQAFFSWK